MTSRGNPSVVSYMYREQLFGQTRQEIKSQLQTAQVQLLRGWAFLLVSPTHTLIRSNRNSPPSRGTWPRRGDCAPPLPSWLSGCRSPWICSRRANLLWVCFGLGLVRLVARNERGCEKRKHHVNVRDVVKGPSQVREPEMACDELQHYYGHASHSRAAHTFWNPNNKAKHGCETGPPRCIPLLGLAIGLG